MKTIHLLLAALLVSSGALCSAGFAAAATRILIVVGPSDHPPGTHEVAAGGRLLAHCLANLPGVKADVVYGWPAQDLRDAAASIVFIGDTFPANRLPNAAQNLADLDAMMRRGCGIVCIHYATGLLGQDVAPDGDHPLLRWLGGYFAHRTCPHHQSVAKIFPAAAIVPAAPGHPVWRGCAGFTLHDEPYINNYFGKDANRAAPNVTVLATSQLPPEQPKPEPVAWCVERDDRGRGFGVVMPHFYRSWKIEDLRRFILNGIVWSARLDVPPGGVQSALRDPALFEPASLEPQPRPAKKAAAPAVVPGSPAK